MFVIECRYVSRRWNAEPTLETQFLIEICGKPCILLDFEEPGWRDWMLVLKKRAQIGGVTELAGRIWRAVALYGLRLMMGRSCV